MAWQDYKMEEPRQIQYELDMDKILTYDDCIKVLRALNIKIKATDHHFSTLLPYVRKKNE